MDSNNCEAQKPTGLSRSLIEKAWCTASVGHPPDRAHKKSKLFEAILEAVDRGSM
jgi:hypothetical protein